MKNFNRKIFSLNMQSTMNLDSTIPKEYFKLATNIANSFSKDYAAIGVMNILDLTQEAYYALIRSWKKVDWKYISTLDSQIDRDKAITKFLSISIKGLVGDNIKLNADGAVKPIKGIWNNEDKKRYSSGFGFISVLFPNWFDTNVLSILEDETYDYDYEKLGDYLEGWLKKYLPKHALMMKMFFGLDDIYSKPKKMRDIAHFFGTNVESVKKQKQRLIYKLKINEDALNELAFFIATNGIKTHSKAYDWAEVKLKIFKD